MSALTTERVCPSPFVCKTYDGLIGANVKIFHKALIVIVGGYWVNATATTGLEGRYAVAMDTVDNLGGAAGAKRINVEFIREKWLWLAENDPASPLIATDLGGICYTLDNKTASANATGKSVLGTPWKFFESNRVVDPTRVWVEVK